MYFSHTQHTQHTHTQSCGCAARAPRLRIKYSSSGRSLHLLLSLSQRGLVTPGGRETARSMPRRNFNLAPSCVHVCIYTSTTTTTTIVLCVWMRRKRRNNRTTHTHTDTHTARRRAPGQRRWTAAVWIARLQRNVCLSHEYNNNNIVVVVCLLIIINKQKWRLLKELLLWIAWIWCGSSFVRRERLGQ